VSLIQARRAAGVKIHGPCPRYEGGNKPRRPRGLWAASAGVAALVAAWPAVHKAVEFVGKAGFGLAWFS
jgi:hypothetical protein